MAEQMASGVVVQPGAGAAIATLAAPPAGVYQVRVTAGVSGSNAADLINMRLRRQGVDLLARLPHGANGEQEDTVLEEVSLNGAQNLTVEAVDAGGITVEYNAAIVATQV